jgi:ribonuclease P/MRP protein subunit POP1
MSTALPQLVPSKSLLSRKLCDLLSCLKSDKSNNRSALAQRAFQDVPRCLRRRSASHNVKRVPRPLRAKATREMIADGTKPTAKIRGSKRLRTEKRRLTGKSSENKEGEDMVIDEELDQGVPKLKPRKVTKGKFAHRQGLSLSLWNLW